MRKRATRGGSLGSRPSVRARQAVAMVRSNSDNKNRNNNSSDKTNTTHDARDLSPQTAFGFASQRE